MGKRKRRAVHRKATPPPSGSSLQVPQVDPQLGQRSPDPAESNESPPHTPFIDIMDSSLKRPSGLESPPSRWILLKNCGASFARPCSGRSSSSHHTDASPSNSKGSPNKNSTLSSKRECKELRAPQSESREMNSALSADIRKMECMICQKRLRKNPSISESSTSPTEVSVVAVLVCGHAYHADCLEQKTSHQDEQDPPCPHCEGQVL